ncbi:hypothetical protein SVAN01_10042 [Stagonosporopsis vannaccii]|nr:hypothetical protein SVAN01_10042 [Stagonosporopsis vannaccii]
MRVIEKGTDRMAEAHIYVEGQVNALEEYGQYTDTHDKAICCYVPVEEGHTIRVEGRFVGTTLAVVHDVLVDGVCRKTNSAVGKTVQVQKKKALFETVLYQTPDGVIDTEMSAATYSGPVKLDKETREAVGTIELLVYITRQFGIEHEINGVCKYDKVQKGGQSSTRVATYKDVPPQFHMKFEKNCSTLDVRKAKGERKKIYSNRPGTEPWAIFRFHYRTEESIIDQNMGLTFDPTDKSNAKKEAHTLDLEPVPMLLLGSRPASRHDGESSMRTSSPPPPDTPLTPVKSSKNSPSTQVRKRLLSVRDHLEHYNSAPEVRGSRGLLLTYFQPKVVFKKKFDKHTLVNSGAASDTTFNNQTQTAVATELSAATIIPLSTFNGLHSAFLESNDDSSAITTTESSLMKIVDNPSGVVQKEVVKADTGTIKASTQQVSNKDLKPTNPDADTKGDSSVKTLDEQTGKTDTDVVDVVPLSSPLEVPNTPTVLQTGLPFDIDATVAPNAMTTPAAVLHNGKDFIKMGSKGFTSPLKKATSKPAPVNTTISTILQVPTFASGPVMPVKRAPEGTLTPPLDLKRLKADAVSPLTSTCVPHTLSTTPSPRTLSIEVQVAEQRQRLQATREKRAEVAKKKAFLDERMKPYKQRMAEELEQLKEKMAEEEAMMAEEEEECKASEAMLAEFERSDDGA